jgi:hypothetical protein
VRDVVCRTWTYSTTPSESVSTRTAYAVHFVAVATGAQPDAFLWRNSGLNWARTNSRLPDGT